MSRLTRNILFIKDEYTHPAMSKFANLNIKCNHIKELPAIHQWGLKSIHNVTQQGVYVLADVRMSVRGSIDASTFDNRFLRVR